MTLEELVDKHEPNFTIIKTIEELNELSVALAQYLTKPTTVIDTEHFINIVSEMADVEIMLMALKYKFGFITEMQIKAKMKKFEEYYNKLGEKIGKLRNENEKENTLY